MLFKVKKKKNMFYSVLCYLKYFLFSTKIVSKENEFLFQFKKEVLNGSIDSNFLKKVEKLRSFYKRENKNLTNEDYGAGSRDNKPKKSINTKFLVKYVAVSRKYGKVLYSLRKYLNATNVLELGTSLGIGSAYLSESELVSIEGNTALHQYTKTTLLEKGFHQITFQRAQFDDILPELLKTKKFELIYIDGNHTFEATKRYFEMFSNQDKMVLIFDDIYWNKEMTEAWKYIKNHKNVSKSIDLFKFGIVFLCNDIETKENYILWY